MRRAHEAALDGISCAKVHGPYTRFHEAVVEGEKNTRRGG